MSTRKMRRVTKGIATAAVMGGVAVLAIVVRITPAPAASPTTSLPRIRAPERGPIRAEWTIKSAHLTAASVGLDATGAHTHGNWILFQLPFDTTDTERIRRASFSASPAIDPDVAAIRVGMACAPYAKYGPI